MRLSLRTKQVAGVTSIVGLAAVVLSLIHLAWIARLGLLESQARGNLLTNAIFQQARAVVTSRTEARADLQRDSGIRSILLSSIGYWSDVTYASIVDARNVVIVHSSPNVEGTLLEPETTLDGLLLRNPFAQLRAIFTARTFEVQQPLLLGDEHFGSIRIGLSTVLVRSDLTDALYPAALSALFALAGAVVAAMLLARWMLRPIHILQSGLARLGQGELGVKLDLPPGDEFARLGSSFDIVSKELATARSQLAGESARFESVVDRLEDAVAIFNPDGELIFGNAALETYVRDAPARSPIAAVFGDAHPFRQLVEEAIEARRSQGPRSLTVPAVDTAQSVETLVTAHAIEDVDRRFMGVMLVARNLAYLGQVESTLQYSRKLAALGRRLAGVAHEVKNPLNAMTIHLELLKQKLSGGGRARARKGPARAASGLTPVPRPESVLGLATVVPAEPADAPPAVDVGATLEHVSVIGSEIRRLDEVVQGFLKFSRPEELELRTIALPTLVNEVLQVIEPQARAASIVVTNEVPSDLPPIGADQAMLRQALLNLAVNAVQAMPDGGRLRVAAWPVGDRLVQIDIEDSGVGIPPEHLEKVFDLYFTTKEGGSGIGLAMVFRTVQLHDGHIEVQSTPGRGTTFRLRLPRDRRREPRSATSAR